MNCIAGTGLVGIPALLKLTTHRSDVVRAAAFDGVAEALDSGLESTALVADRYAEVIRALEDPRREKVVLAFEQLEAALEESDSLAIADIEVLTVLMAGVEDPVPAVKGFSAMQAISRVKHGGHQSGQLFSAAVRALADRNPEVREAAASYLGDASPHAVIPSSEEAGQLRRALADSSRFVRKTAAWLLRTLPGGPHAPEKLLRPSDREPDEPTPEQVVEMINRALEPVSAVQPPEAVHSLDELLEKLRSRSIVMRVVALESLTKGQRDTDWGGRRHPCRAHGFRHRRATCRRCGTRCRWRATTNAAWNLHAALGDSCLQVAKKARSVLGDTMLRMSELLEREPAEND